MKLPTSTGEFTRFQPEQPYGSRKKNDIEGSDVPSFSLVPSGVGGFNPLKIKHANQIGR